MTETIIARAQGLTKKFGSKIALNNVSFEIPAGRIYGLVGQNGAGKTTALNALLGLTDCAGQIEVLGVDPYRKRAALMRDVAFVSDVASLPRYLTVRQLLSLVDDIHPSFNRAKAEAFLHGSELRAAQKIKTLSKGMLAQLHLAVVLAIDAQLLVLDEPTLGLDIVYRKRFYQRLLEDFMSESRTLIITTHQVDEIEFMLTDLIFLQHGEVLLDLPTDQIATRYTQLIPSPENRDAARALSPIYEETRFNQTVMVFENQPQDILAPLGARSTPSLSDLFVTLTQAQALSTGDF